MSALAIKTYQTIFPRHQFLPLDCWEEILERVRQEDLPAASLVCKDFLQGSNKFVNRVKLGCPDVVMASRIFNRFNFLTEVDLGPHVTDDILCLIRESVKSLTSIALWDRRLSSLNSLMELFRERRNLKRVILAGEIISRPTSFHIEELFMLMPNVTEFQFHYRNFIYDRTLLKLLQSSPLLENLCMGVCLGASIPESPSAFKNKNLRALKLGSLLVGNDRHAKALFYNISKWCPKVEALAIKSTYCPTAVEKILMTFYRLKMLCIGFRGEELKFTASSTNVIASLESFTLHGKSVNYKCLLTMSKICPALKKLEIEYYKGCVSRCTVKMILRELKYLRSFTFLRRASDQVQFDIKYVMELRPSQGFRFERVYPDKV